MENIQNLAKNIGLADKLPEYYTDLTDRVFACADKIADYALKNNDHSLYAALVRITGNEVLGELGKPLLEQDEADKIMIKAKKEKSLKKQQSQLSIDQRLVFIGYEAARILGISEHKFYNYLESMYGPISIPKQISISDIFTAAHDLHIPDKKIETNLSDYINQTFN